MINKYLFVLFSTILCMDSGLSSSSSLPVDEDGFVCVQKVNTHMESLFPSQFTSEQMGCFFANKPVTHERILPNPYGEGVRLVIGQLTASEEFYKKVMPYRVQMLTGTAAKYADKITFTGVVEVKDNVINGIYEYTSSYGSLYTMAGYASAICFPVALQLDPSYKILNPNNLMGRCRIFNMRESVLGKHDFVSKPCQLDPVNNMIPDASLYMILNTDSAFIRQTNDIHRLAGNTTLWLLILNQLRYGKLHSLSEGERLIEGDRLYQALVRQKGYDSKAMTLAHYEDCILSVRRDILAILDLAESDLPTFGRELSIPLCEGKLFFLAPEQET